MSCWVPVSHTRISVPSSARVGTASPPPVPFIPPRGKKCECEVAEEVHLPSWGSAQAPPQVLSTSIVVTQPHESAPVSHLQCYNLSLSPCVKLSGTAG